MATRIRYHPRARDDLLLIWGHIAADNERAADRMLDRIADAVDMLGCFPEAGRLRPEIWNGLRSHVVGSYIVFYVVSETALEVVRVLHGAMDITGAQFTPGSKG